MTWTKGPRNPCIIHNPRERASNLIYTKSTGMLKLRWMSTLCLEIMTGRL